MIPTINLDDKTFDDIRDEAIRLIPRYCPEWTNHNASDPGITLIELFSWMTEMTLYRLNKVPQKNYLAMLELMGLSLGTPQSARTIVQFFPVENYEKSVLVKKGTKIASVGEDIQPIVFETEKSLVVRNARLVSCVNRVRESIKENFSEEKGVQEFSLFETENNIEHILYISSPCFRHLKEGHSVQLSFETGCEILSVQDEIINHLFFEYWNGKAWTEVKTASSVKGLKKKDNVVYFTGPLDMESCQIENEEGFFIRAILSDIPENKNTTVLTNISVKSIFEGEGFIPDICVRNVESVYEVVDMNNSFRLFSENPSFNEVFYIAADEIFKSKKSKITLTYMFSEVYVPDTENDNAVFSYEYWNGKDWIKLTRERNELADGTLNFRQSGTVTFKVPKDMSKSSVNNEEHFYIRIRLVTKDFSIGGVYVQDDKGIYQWKFNSKVQSPLLNKIRISYDAPKQKPDKLFVYSCFKWTELKDFGKDKIEYDIFNINNEQLPSLWLGFSSKIKEGEFPIYFDIEEQNKIYHEINFDFSFLPEESSHSRKRFININWEYWNGEKWVKLDMSDYTDSFHESGFIIFNIPEDMCESSMYGKNCFWIKATKVNGSFERLPVIKKIIINGVYAINADTYTNEIIGSGNGGPGQSFNVAHRNILPGLKLAVNEGSIPSNNELEKMKKDGIKEPYTIKGKDVWVVYKEVPNFYNSDAFSRHFVIDYSTGKIIFGDGIHGINPPKGKFNIKVIEYQVGGGEQGNVAAHKLQFLTQSIPYITGCDNPFAATGGCDMETVESLKARSAGVFKSLNRAVTREDFEWISCEASSSVGRAYCLKDKTKDGKIKTVIIPEMAKGSSYQGKLFPSKELQRRVKQYLDERKLVGTEVEVAGPVYRDFKIKLELVFKNNVFDSDGEKTKIKKQLEKFFHPLIGGNGKGFEFGKSVTKGLILKTLEKNQTILSINSVEIFDEDAGVIVETLLSQEDELPYLSSIDVVDRRE